MSHQSLGIMLALMTRLLMIRVFMTSGQFKTYCTTTTTAKMAAMAHWLSKTSRAWKLLALGLLLWIFNPSKAQNASVDLNLGFDGELVAGVWNPLRLGLRDSPAKTLIIEIDQGSLQGGEKLIRYEAKLDGGSGLSIFEDDIYIPLWRSLVWTVKGEGERVLASGSLERRRVDARMLYLVVSTQLSLWLTALEELAVLPAMKSLAINQSPLISLEEEALNLRWRDVLPSNLPERLAAYEGVAALIIDDAFVKPSSILAAAAAGAVVFISPSVQGAYQDLLTTEFNPIGAGWVVALRQMNLTDFPKLYRSLASDLLNEALISRDLASYPSQWPRFYLYISLGIYFILVLMLLYLARVAGLVSALALALMLCLLALYVGPRSDVSLRSRKLYLTGGGLAKVLEHQTLVSLAAQDIKLGYVASGDLPRWQTTPESLTLHLQRWSEVQLNLKPSLSQALLLWQDDKLINLSPNPLSDVYVIGQGQQEGMGGGSSLSLQNGPSDAPLSYQKLPQLLSLPQGSALARQAGNIYIALPPKTF
ncbi:MAG: hypothetical protein R2880_18250 [Deinococcales bacterium]